MSGAGTVGTHSVWSPLQRERIQKTFVAFGVGIAATAASSVLLFRMVCLGNGVLNIKEAEAFVFKRVTSHQLNHKVP